MKKNVDKILLYLAFFITSVCVSAQEAEKIELLEMGAFIGKESLYMKNSQLKISGADPGGSLMNGNEIFIRQVGSNNNVLTKISSPDAIVNLVQQGNDNKIQSNIESVHVRQNVFETGDNNSFFSFANAFSQPVIENVRLNGNNNHVEKYGSNSISNKLEFNIKGNSRSLIIRSYK